VCERKRSERGQPVPSQEKLSGASPRLLQRSRGGRQRRSPGRLTEATGGGQVSPLVAGWASRRRRLPSATKISTAAAHMPRSAAARSSTLVVVVLRAERGPGPSRGRDPCRALSDLPTSDGDGRWRREGRPAQTALARSPPPPRPASSPSPSHLSPPLLDRTSELPAHALGRRGRVDRGSSAVDRC